MFSPLKVAHVAAVLFNGKPDTAEPTTGNVDDFPSNQLKLDVKKQWVNYTLVNNTVREYTIKIWEIAPKTKTPTQKPFEIWNDGLAIDKAIYGDSKGPNMTDVTSAHVGLVPTMSKLFRSQYKVFERTVTLEAGQTHKWTCQGPSMVYDMQKYHSSISESLTELWSPSRWCLISYYPNMVVQTAKAGRFVKSDDTPRNAQHGLMLEYVQHFVIKAPTMAGFTADTIGAGKVNQELDARQDVYHYANYVESTTSTEAVHQTNEVMPMDSV